MESLPLRGDTEPLHDAWLQSFWTTQRPLAALQGRTVQAARRWRGLLALGTGCGTAAPGPLERPPSGEVVSRLPRVVCPQSPASVKEKATRRHAPWETRAASSSLTDTPLAQTQCRRGDHGRPIKREASSSTEGRRRFRGEGHRNKSHWPCSACRERAGGAAGSKGSREWIHLNCRTSLDARRQTLLQRLKGARRTMDRPAQGHPQSIPPYFQNNSLKPRQAGRHP